MGLRLNTTTGASLNTARGIATGASLESFINSRVDTDWEHLWLFYPVMISQGLTRVFMGEILSDRANG